MDDVIEDLKDQLEEFETEIELLQKDNDALATENMSLQNQMEYWKNKALFAEKRIQEFNAGKRKSFN